MVINMKLRQSHLSRIYLSWSIELVDFFSFRFIRLSHFLWENIVNFCGRRELENWGNSIISFTFSQMLWNVSCWNNCRGWKKPLKILCGCVHWLGSRLLSPDISGDICTSLGRIADAAFGGLKLLITWSRSWYVLSLFHACDLGINAGLLAQAWLIPAKTDGTAECLACVEHWVLFMNQSLNLRHSTLKYTLLCSSLRWEPCLEKLNYLTTVT